jgi:lipoprotein-anchoring transpeptidase ErfK/SrfK
MALGMLALCSVLLLLRPNTAYGQSIRGPGHTPDEALLPGFDAVETAPTDGFTLETAASEKLTSEHLTSEDIASEEVAFKIIHVVKAGDNLTRLARHYNVEPADLAAYNQIVDFDHVVIGQKLRIPPAGVSIAPAAVDGMPGASGYHIVDKGDSLSVIGRLYDIPVAELMALNDIADANTVRLGQMLRLTPDVEPVGSARALDVADAPVDGERQIVIDLSDQTLTAYQGGVVVMHSLVSTGKASSPTQTGEYAIYVKYERQHMTGDDYDLPGVPWVMYYDGEFAIHGAYWHSNFGIPTSHGCTNMTIPDAKLLYDWASVGTSVTVQW